MFEIIKAKYFLKLLIWNLSLNVLLNFLSKNITCLDKTRKYFLLVAL